MNNSQFNELLSTMPPLYHTLPGQPFDIGKSEVLAWMLAQPGVKDWLVQRAFSTERIVYDNDTGKWHGHPRDGKPGRPPKITAPVADHISSEVAIG